MKYHSIIHVASITTAGIGNALNAVTAGTLTESIGWTIANDFNKKSKLEISHEEN